RRRHTRSKRDWSSDVCSSDLSTKVGIILVAVTALIAILAPLLAPYDPIATNAENALAGVSTAHPLGTDQYGRDVLSRLLLGGRRSEERRVGKEGTSRGAGEPG